LLKNYQIWNLFFFHWQHKGFKRQQWAEYASSSHNVYCKTYPDVPPIPLMYKLRNKQNRSLIATMLRLQTQHARNPTHLFRLGIKNSPLCECGEVGTLNHIIFSCPQNNPHTQLLLTHLTASNIRFPTSRSVSWLSQTSTSTKLCSSL
jgi:hypothetical protein